MARELGVSRQAVQRMVATGEARALPVSESPTLRFGVFPLGAAGTPDGVATGPADNAEQMAAALERLAGGGRPWLVRMYAGWM